MLASFLGEYLGIDEFAKKLRDKRKGCNEEIQNKTYINRNIEDNEKITKKQEEKHIKVMEKHPIAIHIIGIVIGGIIGFAVGFLLSLGVLMVSLGNILFDSSHAMGIIMNLSIFIGGTLGGVLIKDFFD